MRKKKILRENVKNVFCILKITPGVIDIYLDEFKTKQKEQYVSQFQLRLKNKTKSKNWQYVAIVSVPLAQKLLQLHR